MDQVTKQGEPKLLEVLHLTLTGRSVVSRVITELAVLDVAGAAFHLVELAPGSDACRRGHQDRRRGHREEGSAGC